MASRRVTKTAVDWKAFADRVPPAQIDRFKAFKAKSDAFISRVYKYPETMPKIDFAYYKARMASPAMVDEFQKKYESLNIPYPADKKNLVATINADEQSAQAASAEYAADVKRAITRNKELLAALASLPPQDEMTREMYWEYFPSRAFGPESNKYFSLWPHTLHVQPEMNPHLMTSMWGDEISEETRIPSMIEDKKIEIDQEKMRLIEGESTPQQIEEKA